MSKATCVLGDALFLENWPFFCLMLIDYCLWLISLCLVHCSLFCLAECTEVEQTVIRIWVALVNARSQIGFDILLSDDFQWEKIQNRCGFLEHQMIHKMAYSEQRLSFWILINKEIDRS